MEHNLPTLASYAWSRTKIINVVNVVNQNLEISGEPAFRVLEGDPWRSARAGFEHETSLLLDVVPLQLLGQSISDCTKGPVGPNLQRNFTRLHRMFDAYLVFFRRWWWRLGFRHHLRLRLGSCLWFETCRHRLRRRLRCLHAIPEIADARGRHIQLFLQGCSQHSTYQRRDSGGNQEVKYPHIHDVSRVLCQSFIYKEANLKYH